MPTPPDAPRALALTEARSAELEAALAAMEQGLGALQDAVLDGDLGAIETQATALHRTLARTVEKFMHAARHGGVPPVLRRRLAQASARVAAQRESLARATAALDRAIDVLIPGSPPKALYSASGTHDARPSGGIAQA